VRACVVLYSFMSSVDVSLVCDEFLMILCSSWFIFVLISSAERNDIMNDLLYKAGSLWVVLNCFVSFEIACRLWFGVHFLLCI